MKFSCTPISFHSSIRQGEMDLRGFFRFCAEQGLEGVDILDTEGYPWLWSESDSLEKCVRWANEDGLMIAAYACGNNFAKAEAEARAEQVALVIRAIERAARCGAPLLRIFGGHHAQAGGEASIETASGLEMIIHGVAQCLPHAERAKVILALENHGRLPGHSYEQAAVLDHFRSPWLKALYDPANYIGNNMGEDEDPLRAFDCLRREIIHTHLKDVGPPVRDLKRRREPYVAGQGITPLRQIIAAMVKSGYKGFCALEYEASQTTPEREGVPASLDFLKKCREAALLQIRPSEEVAIR